MADQRTALITGAINGISHKLTKCFAQDKYNLVIVARNEGKILQVSSVGGELLGPLQSVYHGPKAFVPSFTEAVREEVK